MIRFVVVLSALWLACQPVPGPGPIPTPDATDAAVVREAAPTPSFDARPPRPVCVPSTPLCEACGVLFDLDCIEGQKTARGQTCEQVYGPVMNFPGLGFDAPGIAKCASRDCVRQRGIKCPNPGDAHAR